MFSLTLKTLFALFKVQRSSSPALLSTEQVDFVNQFLTLPTTPATPLKPQSLFGQFLNATPRWPSPDLCGPAGGRRLMPWLAESGGGLRAVRKFPDLSRGRSGTFAACFARSATRCTHPFVAGQLVAA